MTRFLVVLSILFLSFMMFMEFMDYQENKKSAVIPEFSDQEIQFICHEEDLI
jgi:hypothetical protein